MVGVGAGLLEAGKGVANTANYVENQAILAASYSGFVPDSTGNLAAQQTGADYQGMANMAHGG
ncbi:MAG: hypothetical protein U5M23_04285 [Marinagarivorans sp.]|nr:hypothetical protein [Marinagarivorans sp.]